MHRYVQMRIGYARVSTHGQNLQAQEDALYESKCEQIYAEHESGKNTERQKLNEMISFIRDGDTVVVTKLDRLARSTKDLLQIAETINSKGASLEVLNIQLDTSSPTGKLMLTMLGAIAEFEREIMLERQKEGIAIAKENGAYTGRKPVAKEKLQLAQDFIESGCSVSQATLDAGISRRTYYKAREEGRI